MSIDHYSVSCVIHGFIIEMVDLHLRVVVALHTPLERVCVDAVHRLTFGPMFGRFHAGKGTIRYADLCHLYTLKTNAKIECCMQHEKNW